MSTEENISSSPTALHSSMAEKAGVRSLGQQFSAAREGRGLTVEAVAGEMRVRAQLIKSIEADDCSVFSHPSYARFFSLDYARFLGLPISEIKDLLPESGFCSSEGYQYLNAIAAQAMRPRAKPSPEYSLSFPFRQWMISLVKLFGLMVLLAAVAYGYLFFHKLDRLPADRASMRIDTIRPTQYLYVPRPPFLNNEVPAFKYKVKD